jgi:hypothetical protein
MARLDKLLNQANEHLDEGEGVLDAILGIYETEKGWSRPGILVATDHRVVLYAKKMGGYFLEVFPYKNLTSIETSKGMTGHIVKFFASGNEVKLTGIGKNSDAPAFVALVKDRMKADHVPPSPVAGDSPDITDQMRKLGQLRDEGLISEEEFETKRAELLARL